LFHAGSSPLLMKRRMSSGVRFKYAAAARTVICISAPKFYLARIQPAIDALYLCAFRHVVDAAGILGKASVCPSSPQHRKRSRRPADCRTPKTLHLSTGTPWHHHPVRNPPPCCQAENVLHPAAGSDRHFHSVINGSLFLDRY